jgi:hypothetical protein
MRVQLLLLVFENGLFIMYLTLLLDDICYLFNLIMMIDSAILETDSDQHLCISIPENNPKNFDDINNNHYETEKSLLDSNNSMKQTSTNHENNTTTMVEVEIKTTNTSSRKRKLNLINQINNDNHINKQPAITKKKVTIEARKIE